MTEAIWELRGHTSPEIHPPEPDNDRLGRYWIHLTVLTDPTLDAMYGTGVGAGDKWTQAYRLNEWLKLIAPNGIIPDAPTRLNWGYDETEE